MKRVTGRLEAVQGYPGRHEEVQNDLSETERSSCKGSTLFPWEPGASYRPLSLLFLKKRCHSFKFSMISLLNWCALWYGALSEQMKQAGENRQVAAFSRCLQVREPAAWSDGEGVHLSSVRKMKPDQQKAQSLRWKSSNKLLQGISKLPFAKEILKDLSSLHPLL